MVDYCNIVNSLSLWEWVGGRGNWLAKVLLFKYPHPNLLPKGEGTASLLKGNVFC
jgi:hypothetical protein